MGQKKSHGYALPAHYKSVSAEPFHWGVKRFALKITKSVDLFTQIELGIKIMKRSKINSIPSLNNIIIIFVGYIYMF